MADIQLVIKIDDKDYQLMKDGHIPFNVLDVIRKGIILPKGHGDLIDRNDLSLVTVHLIDGTLVCNAPTIIEADKES